ncbi:hypothetical protein Lepto7376_2783 [[Leptolyngbya] sp. PCC 7376]|uniref:hypothetical protein n=1 Tax=[Leptolyngbya] sp. PCC 7376 TaxID=111781 RepID=UPI00029F004D|nr:hypothetical protein [[Leptolyngbya] sp. PCC 7376]AFY39040.1 hypothetical protein Lepto7376_2783 [[Leptolyngbya] sp. PCC 7376]
MLSGKQLGKGNIELSPKAHPERFFLLGGAWLIMMTMAVMGGSAIVNPDKRLPVIDPLLEMIAAAKQRESVFTPVKKHYKEAKRADKTLDLVSPVTLAQDYFTDAVESQSDVLSIADGIVEPISESASQSVPPVPATPRDNVPTWMYLAITGSCISGSSILTLLLYKLTAAKATKSQKRARKSPHSRVAQANRVKIPVVNVPAIAPLKISTPKAVAPPQLKIEPIVDPEPAATPKHSRAEYLARLAQNAKQQSPQSLVEMMDIRRRNHLAPFS